VAASNWRADPAKGVFETLLVVGGKPMEMEGHLARLARSLAEIYGSEPAADVRGRARAGGAGVELGRLRLTAVPSPSGLELEVCAGPIDPAIMFPEAGAALRRLDRPGGHGPHKWVDRMGMDHPAAGSGQLICDGEELLEAGWANLFAIREETLWTPALDGRILAGMARAAVLEIARDEGLETQEGSLHAEELLSADEVFLTNSVRGIEPAAGLDGTPLPGCGPISRRLADALRRRWGLQAPQAAASAPKAGQPSR
jgi:para-aminobenzoate synthetase/4-amino-4-deoxychorismate lyase